jgi:heat shock protein HslJ
VQKILLFLLLFSACRPTHKIGELLGVPKERPIENTHWILTQINEIDLAENSKQPFIQLNPDGNKINGFGGCNQLAGQYTQLGKKITFRTTATRMFCQETMEIETNFLQALENTTEFDIEKHILLLKMDKKILLTFRAETKFQN